MERKFKGDWKCQDCGYNNFADRVRCRQCGWQDSAKTETVKKTMPGDWICVCGIHNFRSRVACFGCSRPLEQNNKLLGDWKKGDWMCTGCKYHNYSKNETCRKCEIPKAANMLAQEVGEDNEA